MLEINDNFAERMMTLPKFLEWILKETIKGLVCVFL